MGKPSGKIFDDFCDKFYAINKRLGKKQYIIPYLMSSHPGSRLQDAIELAEYLRDIHYQRASSRFLSNTRNIINSYVLYRN